MHLAFDIFQAIGVALAVGVRPFLPGLAAGALAAGDIEIQFDHTSYSFLQSLPFLLAMFVGGALLVMLERGIWAPRLRGGPLAWALTLVSLALGALFFAGSLARDHHAAWPGLVGGVICVVVGMLAARPFLMRLRGRLDAASAAVGLPIVSDGSALLVAVLSIVAPPLGIVALVLALWLLLAGRGRGERRYAGLRILR